MRRRFDGPDRQIEIGTRLGRRRIPLCNETQVFDPLLTISDGTKCSTQQATQTEILSARPHQTLEGRYRTPGVAEYFRVDSTKIEAGIAELRILAERE